MTQYSSVKTLSDLQLEKLKSAAINPTGVTLRLSTNMVGNANDDSNFPLKS